MKNAVLWDVTPCGSCTLRASVANCCYFVPCSPILVALMTEAIRSSETSGLTRATRRNISENGILHSHRPKQTPWALVRVQTIPSERPPFVGEI
jgi:hypothetical protein